MHNGASFKAIDVENLITPNTGKDTEEDKENKKLRKLR
jgi:hypothetical protein